MVLVGDRGLITSARIEAELRPAGFGWITALRAPAIQALAAEDGPLQLSLFDDRDLAEIESPAYLEERLIVCKNPLLAADRGRKRSERLDATERTLRAHPGAGPPRPPAARGRRRDRRGGRARHAMPPREPSR